MYINVIYLLCFMYILLVFTFYCYIIKSLKLPIVKYKFSFFRKNIPNTKFILKF